MKVSLYHLEDWFGLYVDGKLVDEGHVLDVGDFIRRFSDKFDFEVKHVSYDRDLDDAFYALGMSSMPDTESELENIKKEYNEMPTTP